MIQDLLGLLVKPPFKTEGTSVRAHSPFFYWVIENLKPDTLVELGIFNGDSFYSWCKKVQLCNLPTQCFAVDNWKGDVHVGMYSEELYARFMQYLEKCPYKSFVHVMRGTFDEAAAKFAPNSINLVHIDGTHTYEAVKHDYEMWLPRMSTHNGIMMFHDSDVVINNFGVKQLMTELKPLYPHFEFYHSFGETMLLIGKDVPKPIKEITELSPGDTDIIRRAFEALGNIVMAME